MPSLRFVQTGDWHLGQAYRNVEPELAERLRAGRLDAVGRTLAEADRRGAAFAIAAGDQFDGPQPSPGLVRELFDRVEAYPGVVVHLIPGNHDPCGPGSIYRRGDVRYAPANLRIYREAGPVRIAEHSLTLFPCPCPDRFGEDPMAWIPGRLEGDGWRVAIAHGSLPGFAADSGERNYPIFADAPARYDLDYVALGDWHTPTPHPEDRPAERIYYAGAPEVGGWDETGAGFALDVVLESGRPPRVEAFRVGGFDWWEARPELHHAADLAALAGTLDQAASPDRVARVRPKGALGLADRQALDALIARFVPHFASLDLDSRDLRIAVGGDDAIGGDPIVREVARRLLRLAADPSDGAPQAWPKDLTPPDAEAARRALDRLRDLIT